MNILQVVNNHISTSKGTVPKKRTSSYRSNFHFWISVGFQISPKGMHMRSAIAAIAAAVLMRS
jgi:hypothetical protein